MKRVLASEVPQYKGKDVILKGWIHRIRRLGELSFLILRDRSGLVQTAIEGDIVDFSKLSIETAVQLEGRVVSEGRAPGGFEVRVKGIEVLSESIDVPPIEVNKGIDLLKTDLDKILSYRPISLRNPEILAIFKVQAELIWAFREFLSKEGFTEIQTPKIVGTATEGGSDLFPVQYFEKRAYLAQSPQFYKQIMVGSGLERVFEVGHAYRAEEHNTARHLNEYISLDLEMGFIEDEQDVIQLHTNLLRFIFNHLKAKCSKELKLYKVEILDFKDIPQIPLAEAKRILKREFKKDLKEAKDLDPEGERLICQWVKKDTGNELLYITDYPVEKRPVYTMPREDDPSLTRSFDLLYKGVEITTGSQRIHNYHQLIESIRKFKLDERDFEFYLQTFRHGMPPHGGLAIGAERLTKQILGLANIREASLFPRDRTRIVP